MTRILCCGIVTLDIINHVPHYPAEDEELRATAHERRSGGNATNTARVLAQHGHEVALTSTVADDAHGDWLLAELTRAGVDTRYCPRLSGTTPTSYILLNTRNGSRTIVHYRDLAELAASEIQQAITGQFDWLHFEGRNVMALKKVLVQRQPDRRQHVSIEAEKPRDGLETLFPFADIIMLSRPWAEAAGHDEPASLLRALKQQYPQQRFTCTWGQDGAWFSDPAGDPIHVPALPVARVVDSIGAGDCFNAGLIHALSTGNTLEDAVHYATALAAKKISQQGVDGLLPLPK